MYKLRKQAGRVLIRSDHCQSGNMTFVSYVLNLSTGVAVDLRNPARLQKIIATTLNKFENSKRPFI